MKRLVMIFLLSAINADTLFAQDVITPANAKEYLNQDVIMFGKVLSIDKPDSLRATRCVILNALSEKEFAILVPLNAIANSSVSFLSVGQTLKVSGAIRYGNELYLEAKHLSEVKSNITNVVLSPPPDARYWAEQTTEINVNEIIKHIGDTVKISGKIYDYRVAGKTAVLYIAPTSSNHVLPVILKDDAKKYLDAQLQVKINGKSSLKELKNKTLKAIGTVSFSDNQPELIVADPNGFIIY